MLMYAIWKVASNVNKLVSTQQMEEAWKVINK